MCSEEPQTREEGKNVVLGYCMLTSPVQLSELRYQWRKQREDGAMVEINSTGTKYDVNLKGLLTIMNAQPSDSGRYEVSISNDQGTAVHEVHLQIKETLKGKDKILIEVV